MDSWCPETIEVGLVCNEDGEGGEGDLKHSLAFLEDLFFSLRLLAKRPKVKSLTLRIASRKRSPEPFCVRIRLEQVY